MSQVNNNLGGMTNISTSQNDVVRGSDKTTIKNGNVPLMGGETVGQPNVTTDLSSLPFNSIANKLGADIRMSVNNDLKQAFAEASPVAANPSSTGFLNIGSGDQPNVQGNGLSTDLSTAGKGGDEKITITRSEFEALVANLVRDLKEAQAKADSTGKNAEYGFAAPWTGSPPVVGAGGSQAPPIKPLGSAPTTPQSTSDGKEAGTSAPADTTVGSSKPATPESTGQQERELSASKAAGADLKAAMEDGSEGLDLYKKTKKVVSPGGINEFEQAALDKIAKKYNLDPSQLGDEAGASKGNLDQLLKKAVDTYYADGVITDTESKGIEILTAKGGGKNLSENDKLAMLTKILEGTKGNFGESDFAAFSGVLDLMASDTTSTSGASGAKPGAVGVGDFASPPTNMSMWEFTRNQLKANVDPYGLSDTWSGGNNDIASSQKASNPFDPDGTEKDEDEDTATMQVADNKSKTN